MHLCDPIMQTCGLWRLGTPPRLAVLFWNDQYLRGARHGNCFYRNYRAGHTSI
jgi:hypothetical protein